MMFRYFRTMLLMVIDSGELMLCAASSRCYTLWPLRSKAKTQLGRKRAPTGALLDTRSVRRASDSVQTGLPSKWATPFHNRSVMEKTPHVGHCRQRAARCAHGRVI